MAQYTHTTAFHNLQAPREIVPYIMDLLHPHSVVDVGCGLGTFLRAFKEKGVQEIQGIDGPWCRKELLFENMQPEEFLETNMESVIVLDRKFDLAVCLEVAEHLTPQRADSFVHDLTKLSDLVLFAAAIPRQGGEHHYNEQWLGYWQTRFEQHGYQLFDVFKPMIWNNEKIFWWYKQNMVLFVKKGKAPEKLQALPTHTFGNIIHPELFETVTDYREKNAIKRYLRALYKSMLFRLGLIK